MNIATPRLDVRPALCLDLDGTVRRSKKNPSGFIQGPDDVELIPGMEERIWAWKRKHNALVLGVSNQGGVAHGFKTVADVRAELEATQALFARDPFDYIKVALSDSRGSVEPFCHRSLGRKPYYGMLAVMEETIMQQSGVVVDWDRSLFVGDREEDRQCAEAAGIAFQWAHEFLARPSDGAPLVRLA